jgi:hypothetical protein
MIVSVLDLAPVVAGSTAADAFRRSVDLAQHVERYRLDDESDSQVVGARAAR